MILGWSESSPVNAFGFRDGTGGQPRNTVPELIVDKGEGHILVQAPTASGKSRCLAVPALLHWQGSAVVLDIKGELANTTALYRHKALGQEVVVLDPFGVSLVPSAAMNPLDRLVAAGDDILDRAQVLASQLEAEPLPREPYWGERARELIAGAMVDVATSPDQPDRSLGAVWRLLNHTSAEQLLALRMGHKQQPPLHPAAATAYGNHLDVADTTRSCILSTARSMLSAFASPRVQAALSRSSFDFEALNRDRPVTIYLVLPIENVDSHAPLMRLWLSTFLSQIMARRTRPETPTLLLLDEIAQLGPMPQVQRLVTLGRTYGARAMLFLQSQAQLVECYPRAHRTIADNCTTTIVFGQRNRRMAVESAEVLGDIGADALYRMRPDQMAIKQGSKDTVIARRLDYLTDPMFAGRFSPNPLYGPAPKLTLPRRRVTSIRRLPRRRRTAVARPLRVSVTPDV